jgi:hypothetical protein
MNTTLLVTQYILTLIVGVCAAFNPNPLTIGCFFIILLCTYKVTAISFEIAAIEKEILRRNKGEQQP